MTHVLMKNDVLKLLAHTTKRNIQAIKQDYKLLASYSTQHEWTDKFSVTHYHYCGYLYLVESVRCYYELSSGNIAKLAKHRNVFKGVRAILDLGGGCGLTSLHLAAVFPNAVVCYHNLKGSDQWRFAMDLFDDQCARIKHIDEKTIFQAGQWAGDMVVALEFFEHLKKPVEYLDHLLSVCSPRYLVLANSFSLPHPDHHEEFEVAGELISAKSMARRFNSELIKRGYKLHPVTNKFWNRRPTVWVYDGE